MVELTLGNQSIRRSGSFARTDTRSKGIDATVYIDGGSGVGDGAGGNEIGPGFGEGANVFERNTAGDLGLRAVIDEANFDSGLLRRHVVEQQSVSSTGKRVFDFGSGADLDFDRFLGGPGALDRGADAAGQPDMVVLDQDRIVQAHAVIHGSARGGGHFFQDAEAGGGLARIENTDAGAFYGLDEFRGERCDSGEALKEIQRDALAGEQRARGGSDGRDGFAGTGPVAGVFLDMGRIEEKGE